MGTWLFVSDLHGRAECYTKLFRIVADEKPAAVLFGGDILPGSYAAVGGRGQGSHDFIRDFLMARLMALRATLDADYPRMFFILGNDDPGTEEEAVRECESRGLCEYLHGRQATCEGCSVFGYACVPPTPFLLKDWERYDVSRHLEPGCVSPEEGCRTVLLEENRLRYGSMRDDLADLFGDRNLERAVCLFHAPPYNTNLDRAALDRTMVDHAPLDVHVGSVAIRRFIEDRQPLVTLHGHIHESARLTGSWREQIGRTHCFSAAHDGPELAVVRFDPADAAHAARVLV